MTILAVRTSIVRLANRTLKTSYGDNVTERDHVFVAVDGDDGLTGFGEGSPLPHFSGERASEMAPVIDSVLAPAVVGADPLDLEWIDRAMARAITRHHAAKAAVLNAVHDLAARRARVPAGALVGGVVQDAVPLAGAVGIEDDETIMQKVAGLREAGIGTVKVKIGADLDRDVRIVRALRAEFPKLEIRADANSNMRFADAVRFLRAIEDCRLQYLEQPLPGHDHEGLAALRGRGTPIAADESLFGVADALRLAGRVDVLVIKLIKLGGLLPARKAVSIAEAAGMTCTAVSPYESALGVAANLHLAASSSAFSAAAELGTSAVATPFHGAEALTVSNGYMSVPRTPGWGVDLPDTLFAGGEVGSSWQAQLT